MWVVKLGGSLATSPELADWLEVLACAGAGSVAIVPGGGPFADAVRAAQARWGFDDSTAHQMALKAMDQFGLMLCGCGGFVCATTLREILERVRARRVPVWLPSAAVINEPEIPASWEVTSDSLAAWLARKLRAEGLALVKSCARPDARTPLLELAQQGIVDRRFPSFAAGVAVRFFAREDANDFFRALQRAA
jgi:aspartokinase-like uncharacterized kinase